MTPWQRTSLAGATAAIALFVAAAVFNNSSHVRAQDGDAPEDIVEFGLKIAPVPLNLANKDRDLVGLGSYIVNGIDNYQRWAIDPRELVTNAVTDHLRASGNFSQVKSYDGRPDINYVLSGRLEKLDEIDYEGGVKVEVAISAQMVQLSTGATVWENSVTDVGQVEKRTVPALVSAMNRTMGEAIEKLLTPGPSAYSGQATTTSTPGAE